MIDRTVKIVVVALIALPLSLALAEENEKGKGKGRPGEKGGRPGGQGFTPPKFADIDTDSSGDVNKEEWIAFQVKMAQERAERSFGFVSGDDEKITEEELKKMMSRRGGPGGFPKGGPGGEKGKGKGKGPGGEESGGGTKPKRPALEE
ncbi:MAG: hypothetical protein P1V20_01845 [Verrucomicrobiales bacterium]|nr:hypothetical protein [Verrucomicrobiales bacterium]